MPFPAHLIVNWLQHLVANGVCTRCGIAVKTDVTGVVYAKPGMLYLATPTTKWTECQP